MYRSFEYYVLGPAGEFNQSLIDVGLTRGNRFVRNTIIVCPKSLARNIMRVKIDELAL